MGTFLKGFGCGGCTTILAIAVVITILFGKLALGMIAYGLYSPRTFIAAIDATRETLPAWEKNFKKELGLK